MLLRSSSTPISGSLLPFTTHSEPLVESTESDGAFAAFDNAKSLSFSSSGTNCPSLISEACQASGWNDDFSGEGRNWEFDGELVPWPGRFRRAQSENDLQNLSRGPATPARVAANSLLSNDQGDGWGEGIHERDSGKPWSRKTALRRGRSLSAIPSAYLGTCGLDRKDFIPEEEVDEVLDESPGVDAGEKGRRSLFDRLGVSVEETEDQESTYESYLNESSAGSRELEVKGGEVSVKENEAEISEIVPTKQETKANSKEGEEQIVPTKETKALNSNGAKEEEEEAVFLGRGALKQLADGEYYSTSSVGRDGAMVVCNSRGCRPLYECEKASVLCMDAGLDGSEGGSGGGGGGRASVACNGGGGGGGGPGADSNLTDLYYQKMLAENPGHPLLLRNYAQYLAESKHDYFKAEGYYERAILANPGDGEILAQYAKIIWDVRRDYDRASSYFERAVQAAPDDSYVMAAHASFLWNSEEEEEEDASRPFHSLPSLVSAAPA